MRLYRANLTIGYQIEEAGEEGRVQEATQLTEEVEKLQSELSELKNVGCFERSYA